MWIAQKMGFLVPIVGNLLLISAPQNFVGFTFWFGPRLAGAPHSSVWHFSQTIRPMFLRMYLPRKPVLTLSSLHADDSYAELSSRYKASHVRMMLCWLQKKCQKVADDNGEDVMLQVLSECCFSLQRATEIQSMCGIILGKNEAAEASKCLFVFVGCYSWLALACHDKKWLLFKCRPKLHYIMHTAEDLKSLRLNQLKLFSAFTEESFLGRIKSIAQQVHGRTFAMRVFQRYLLVFALVLHQFKERMDVEN